MTSSSTASAPARRTRRWITDRRPQDSVFWEETGHRVARRNLPGEHPAQRHLLGRAVKPCVGSTWCRFGVQDSVGLAIALKLPSRRDGVVVRLTDGRQLLVHADRVLIDGVDVPLSPAPAAVLSCLPVNPGHVVSRQTLLAALPSGIACSEHAVEMAVARLRAAKGTGRRDDRFVGRRGVRTTT